MKNTIDGVYLAKNVIQICVINNNKVISNDELTSQQFMISLFSANPITIVYEACSMSNYWKQEALKCAHDARLVSARLASIIR
tara:strand:+ start:61 stop:309 length:249 start_codon:yes stop_codon:yes gene_type:complete